MLLLYEQKCLVRLPTVASNDIKVEPQSLQLRSQKDRRRPVEAVAHSPLCLSPQTTPEVLYTDCSSTKHTIAETGLETGNHTGYRQHHRPKANRSVNVLPGFGGASAALANHADVAKDVPCIPPATLDCLNVSLPVSGKNIRAQLIG
ncbi:GL25145 [Drosophila persimilis]|uniref:GL25145 n=1 Tax=Drosophila persimilis TaxID=7234 RepID=B4GR46_DROPE|nr:GL25145 [Drosophila persimilis]